MASYTLYPPIVDGYMPAFIAGNNSYCRVYFSLSKFNGSTDFKNVQISITKQTTGEKVIKTGSEGSALDKDGNLVTLYRNAGIILDMPVIPVSVDDNLYYIDIATDNLNTTDGSYNGWVPGVTYKVQLRLSEVSYGEDNPQNYGQSTWLNAYASYFSEWSTVCIVKPTCQPTIYFTSIDSNGVLSGSELIARYNNEDYTEPLYEYKATLKSKTGTILDSSDWLLSQKNVNQSSIRYTFKYEVKFNTEYIVELIYRTLNGYEETITKTCHTTDNTLTVPGVELITLETDYDLTRTSTGDMASNQELIYISNLYDEEEEGRIAYMLNGSDVGSSELSGVYYIRRSDSTTNFTVWKDIKKFDRRTTKTFDKEVWYDYTIKDGIYYKYGIQGVAADGTRGPLRVACVKTQGTEPIIVNEIPSLREVHYAFLVGQNEQQLKLQLDNNISSFKINVTDSNNNTIGGVYPITRRVGNTKYKSFTVNGMISFNMDENNLFISRKDIYNGYDEVAALYTDKEVNDGKYNYMYEREFREKVLQFLTNGKVKLFKSATEGNLLVKLSDVSCTPNQQLSRLVYTFSATATEIAEFNIENCLKYKITSLGEEGNRVHIKNAQSFHPHSHE